MKTGSLWDGKTDGSDGLDERSALCWETNDQSPGMYYKPSLLILLILIINIINIIILLLFAAAWSLSVKVCVSVESVAVPGGRCHWGTTSLVSEGVCECGERGCARWEVSLSDDIIGEWRCVWVWRAWLCQVGGVPEGRHHWWVKVCVSVESVAVPGGRCHWGTTSLVNVSEGVCELSLIHISEPTN